MMRSDIIRVLHFSDIHLPVPFSRLELRRLFGKRGLGALNLFLNRLRHFRQARKKLASLAAFADSHEIDLVIFTGDCTNLGTAPEFAAAREAMDGLTRAPLGLVVVPGNHDLYTEDSIQEKLFEREFGAFLTSDPPELSGEGGWPLVRLVSDSLAVVCVNGAKPNPEIWASNGRIPDQQLTALTKALSHESLRDRFVFVVTHFAPRRMNGTPDIVWHGLANGEELLGRCAGLKRGAILHGHIHWRYCLRIPGVSPPVFNSGSATYAGREGFWVYELNRCNLDAFPGRWSGDRYVLETEPKVRLTFEQ